MSDNTYARGRFVWRELVSPDFDGSKAFYSSLLGWTFEDHPMPDGKGVYPTIMMGERALGGMISLQSVDKEDVPPCWMSYVSIAHIDETAAAAQASGGVVAKEPTTIPTVGRFSVIGDPQHAFSNIIDFEMGDPMPEAQPSVGTFCWEQLNTTDVDGAVAFYQKVYGWEMRRFEAAGNLATFHAGEVPVAAVMPAPEGVHPHWMTYVVVENLVASRDQAIKLGATVMVESVAVPQIGELSVLSDPQGAVIGIFQPLAG